MNLAQPSQVKLDEGKVRVALGDADTPGIVLFIIALSNFGPAVMGDDEEGIDPLDPAEMWAELNTRYGTWVTEEGENRLNALISGLRGGMFWRDLDVFMAVCTALLDGDLGDLITTGFEELTSAELMWAILEMGLAWDSDDTPEFSRDIRQFVEDVLSQEQEDQDANSQEVEKSYLLMLDQMHDLGVPASMIRAWDEEYAVLMENLEDGRLD